MPLTTADKRANFRKLHESGCFILPNPFDAITYWSMSQRPEESAFALRAGSAVETAVS